MAYVAEQGFNQKYVINTAIVLTWTRPVETPYDLFWPTCFVNNLQIKSEGKVRSRCNQLFLEMNNILSTNTIALVLFTRFFC